MKVVLKEILFLNQITEVYAILNPLIFDGGKRSCKITNKSLLLV